MLKIIHTADWHLGQTIFEYDRREEHIIFLNWLKSQINSSIDALLICGDVFDSPNPSADSQKLFYSFLSEISILSPNTRVIIIAGNHDSAARLEAPSDILSNFNITIKGIIRRLPNGEIDFNDLIVPITDKGYCLAIPYIRQGDYPSSESYTQGVEKMYQTILSYIPNANLPIIAMGHLQATGSEISDSDLSERTNIGGIDGISPVVFDNNIKYTALGHLHRNQKVSGRDNIRYSGAPLPMSFAEKNNKQGVNLVTIDNEKVIIEKLDFDTPVKMISIPNVPMPIFDVLNELRKLPDGVPNKFSPLLEIKILITEPEPSLRYIIEKELEGKEVRLARIASISDKGDKTNVIINTYEELKEVDPFDMALNIFNLKYSNNDMPEVMQKLLKDVIEEVNK